MLVKRLGKTADRELVERSFNVHSFKGHLLTNCAYSKTEHEPQRRRANRTPSLRHTQAHFATITTSCSRLPFGICVPFFPRAKNCAFIFLTHTQARLFLTCGSLCVCSTSDCAVLLRSRRTKRGGIMSARYLSMRVLSVVPRYAVAVGSLAGGNGNRENT